jgi:hypothetical protein
MKLKKGKKYDTNQLRYAGWSNANDENIAGYSAWAYFDSESGEYLGPDVYGVEPLFEKKEG